MNGLQIRKCNNEKTTQTEYIFSILISALIITGFVGVFLSDFELIAPYKWMYIVGGLAGSLLYICLCPRSWKDRVFVVGCGILLVLFLISFERSKAGIYDFTNQFLKFLTGKSGKVWLDYPVEDMTGIFCVTALFVGFLSLVISRAVSFGRRIAVFALFILTLAGSVIGLFQVDAYWLLLIVGIVCLLFYRQLLDASQSRLWKSTVVSGFTIALCLGISVLVGFVTPVNTWDAVDSTKRAIHKAIYDDAFNAMPEGNLSDVNRFVKSDHIALTMTVEKPQKFYLRGLVGEVYTGTSWEPFREEVRIENENLFYWLHKMDFYGQNAISKASVLAGNNKQYGMKITNVSACESRQYVPYGLSGSEALDANLIGDGTISSNQKEYFYSYTEGSIPQWYEAALYLAENQEDTKVQEYLRLEQTYREFVYENDLQITNSVVGVCETLFGTGNEERTLSEILDLVRNTLEEQISYNDMIYTLNGNNDFFQYTMEQRKEGYSVHFATAATLMLRYFGVPARYVEGYYISAEGIETYKTREEISLTEANAHAWTEFYLDGVGWIPFEVTPGYIDEDELLETQATIADGLGLEEGKTFVENPLKYSPPPSPREDLQTPDMNSRFRFRIEILLYIGLGVLVLLLLLCILWIRVRRRKLLEFWTMTEQADNKKAIIELFGYGVMLMNRCKVHEESHWDEISKINEEALFSTHEMRDEQRQRVQQFVNELVIRCKKEGSLLKNIRYHYILWLYR